MDWNEGDFQAFAVVFIAKLKRNLVTLFRKVLVYKAKNYSVTFQEIIIVLILTYPCS